MLAMQISRDFSHLFACRADDVWRSWSIVEFQNHRESLHMFTACSPINYNILTSFYFLLQTSFRQYIFSMVFHWNALWIIIGNLLELREHILLKALFCLSLARCQGDVLRKGDGLMERALLKAYFLCLHKKFNIGSDTFSTDEDVE